jgi:anaerobic sulfite reductase subunit B
MLAPAEALQLAPPGGAAPWGVPDRYRVVARRRETPGVVTLALRPLDGDETPFAPGQFNMVYAPGAGEVPISIAGLSQGGALLHTIRSVGGVTRALCATRPGAVLGVRGPFGTGWEVERAAGRDVVVVAGGIGLAPLRPAIERILAERGRYGHVSILAGARSPDLLLYPRLVSSWRSRFDVHVDVTVDTAGPGWGGNVGLVTELLDGAPFDPASADAFVCGPDVMMRIVARALADRGVLRERIRVSLERNMRCGIGQCGHCQLGPVFVCTDGPVFPFERVEALMSIREL